MKLNEMGKIIKNAWELLPGRFPVALDEFQIMPNHVHFVLIISCRRGIARNAQPNTMRNAQPNTMRNAQPNTMRNAQYDVGFARKTPTFGTVTTGSLSCVIRSFKSECTKQINIIGATRGSPRIRVWQRNYYKHIIRTKTDLNKIREYIKNNPQMWGSGELVW